MIQIEDYDMPITVAEKLVSGTKEVTLTPIAETIRRAIVGEELGDKTTGDMFDLEENKEIADYLMVYYQAHQNGD